MSKRAHGGAGGPSPPIAVVGIGADGWAGLGEAARAAVSGADLIVGGARHLALLPSEVAGERRAWATPLSDTLDELEVMSGRRVCVLASGDPMLHGVGASLAARVGPGRLEVYSRVSAHAIACARLGWAVHDTELVSTVARPVEVLAPLLAPGRRVVVYVSAPDGAAAVARVARERSYGSSRMVVMEELGGAAERVVESTCAEWDERPAASLHLVALECRLDAGATPLPRVPGLPDDAFEHDGQLTKREVRAVTLAALAPLPGQRLWDVGAGSGSIAIEWMRAHPSCRAVAVEASEDRAERIGRNALALGAPGLEVVVGRAPEALAGLVPPDAVFVGGGASEPGLLEHCLAALPPGARLVANAVTLEGEQALADAHQRHGGHMVRLAVEHAEPVGRFRAWRPAMAVVQWRVEREPV